MSYDPDHKQKYDQFIYECERYGVKTNHGSVILPGDDVSWYQPEMFISPQTAGLPYITWHRLFRKERRTFQKERRKK